MSKCTHAHTQCAHTDIQRAHTHRHTMCTHTHTHRHTIPSLSHTDIQCAHIHRHTLCQKWLVQMTPEDHPLSVKRTWNIPLINLVRNGSKSHECDYLKAVSVTLISAFSFMFPGNLHTFLHTQPNSKECNRICRSALPHKQITYLPLTAVHPGF